MKKSLLTGLLLLAIFSASRAYAAGYLGVVLQPLTRDLKESMGIDKELRGVLIADVEEDSPADECGLEKGDVILEIDDQPVATVREAIQAIREHQPGDRVSLKVLRGSSSLTLEAQLGERDKKDLPRIRKAVEKIKEVFPPDGAYLGVRVEPISRSLGDYFGVKEGEGVLIVEVIKNSPAEKAGLEPGDVILEVDGRKVSNPESLVRMIKKSKPGESVEIKYKRKNRTRTVEVMLEKRFARFEFDPFREGHCPFRPKPRPQGIPEVEIYKYFQREYDIEPFEVEEFEYPMTIDEIREEIESLKEEIKELRERIENLRE